jgi:hypothetical protein
MVAKLSQDQKQYIFSTVMNNKNVDIKVTEQNACRLTRNNTNHGFLHVNVSYTCGDITKSINIGIPDDELFDAADNLKFRVLEDKVTSNYQVSEFKF